MLDFLNNLQTIFVAAIVAVATIVNQTPPPTPVPMVTEINDTIKVEGTYTYLGYSVDYLFLVPRFGGSFSGSVNGTCNAEVIGEYSGGEGGRVNGKATGVCDILFTKYNGSVGFNGNLYPSEKKVSIDIPNFKEVSVYYN